MTGPFRYNGGSVRSFALTTNFSFPSYDLSFNETEHGVFCYVSRPLTKERSCSHPYISLGSSYGIPDAENIEYPRDARYHSPLLFTVRLLLFSTYWSYSLASQHFKVFTVKESLLLLIISSNFGEPFFSQWSKSCKFNYITQSTPWNVAEIKNCFNLFLERLVLILASSGFGVWRSISHKVIYVLTIGSFVSVIYHTILRVFH